MDDQEFSGTASEFLAMRADAGDEIPSPSDDSDDTPSQASADQADATDDDSSSADDGLTDEERVAAVFAQDAADDAAIAEPDAAAETLAEADDEADADDLSQMTPEQLRALAEEALQLRAQLAERNVDAEQETLLREVAALDAQAVQRVQQRYEQSVIATSDRHYGGLLHQAAVELRRESQSYDDPDQYFDTNIQARQSPILRAQRTWEAKQAAAWEGEVEAEVTRARKTHAGLRRRFAEHLVEERGLPQKAVEELLKITNTDDMPEAAEMLKASVAAYRKQKTQSQQALREQAAKSAPSLQSPSTGRPAARKPVELKGTPEEWLEMRRHFAQ